MWRLELYHGTYLPPDPADVGAALIDGVREGGGGGTGDVVAGVGRVDDVRQVLGDGAGAGRDRKYAADTKPGGAVPLGGAALG